MKKLLAIAVVLTSLFLGGCVGIPSAHMSGSIGIGPQGYGYQNGYNQPHRGYPYANMPNSGVYTNPYVQQRSNNAVVRGMMRQNMHEGKTIINHQRRGYRF